MNPAQDARHQYYSNEATMANSRENGALPNLLLSTTYALNRSNTKRICVGLEANGDSYLPVVKLTNSGSAYMSVTLDSDQWEALKNHFEIMGSYFNRCYDFQRQYGSNHTGSIHGYEIRYSTTYGHKSIIIDEKPEEHNAQPFVPEPPIVDDSPKSKKIKGTHFAGIAMQHTTFEGLTAHAQLIDLHLSILNEQADQVARTIGDIMQYLGGRLVEGKVTDRDAMEKAKNIVKDIRVFKQYFATNFAGIEGYVEQEAKPYDNFIKLLVREILAFGLHDLRRIFENNLNTYNYFKQK